MELKFSGVTRLLLSLLQKRKAYAVSNEYWSPFEKKWAFLWERLGTVRLLGGRIMALAVIKSNFINFEGYDLRNRGGPLLFTLIIASDKLVRFKVRLSTSTRPPHYLAMFSRSSKVQGQKEDP